jgi:hypothetical protein
VLSDEIETKTKNTKEKNMSPEIKSSPKEGAELLTHMVLRHADHYPTGEEREAFMQELDRVLHAYALDCTADVWGWLDEFNTPQVEKDFEAAMARLRGSFDDLVGAQQCLAVEAMKDFAENLWGYAEGQRPMEEAQ